MPPDSGPRRESPREAAAAVAARLRAAGHVAYFAGGCVRDRLRGETPTDYDVATDATPERIRELFPRSKGVGEAFGVVLVRRGGHTVEVATFRSDGEYLDGRRPSSIRFGTLEEDARRRDFTINGLFEDPETGEVVDLVGGLADLEKRQVRAIGDPHARLAEDPLRALRAPRFAARFGYEIEPSTRRAVAAAGGELRGVSRERVGHELRRMLGHSTRAAAAAELEALGLDAQVLLEGSQRSALALLRRLPAEARFETALVAWLIDRMSAAAPADSEPSDASGTSERRSDGDVQAGQDATGQIAASGEAASPPSLRRLAASRSAARACLRAWARALVLSNAEADLAAAILDRLCTLSDPGPEGWRSLGVAGRKRVAASPGFDEAMQILRAADPAAADAVAAEVEELARTGLAPPPLVGGDQLIADLGLTPGPHFKQLLEEAYDAQLEGRVRTREEALAFVARRLDTGCQRP